MNVKLADGRLALTADIGSKANACGDRWAKEALRVARENGHPGEFKKRNTTLHLEGVGHGSQVCDHDVFVPGVMPTTDGNGFRCVYQGPVIPDSDVPALFGLEPMSKLNTIIDCKTKRLHFLPSGDGTWERHLPPGTRTVQGELSPTGHLMLPFAEYLRIQKNGDFTPQVNLASVQNTEALGKASLHEDLTRTDEKYCPTCKVVNTMLCQDTKEALNRRFCHVCGNRYTRQPDVASPTLSPTEPFEHASKRE